MLTNFRKYILLFIFLTIFGFLMVFQVTDIFPNFIQVEENSLRTSSPTKIISLGVSPENSSKENSYVSSLFTKNFSTLPFYSSKVSNYFQPEEISNEDPFYAQIEIDLAPFKNGITEEMLELAKNTTRVCLVVIKGQKLEQFRCPYPQYRPFLSYIAHELPDMEFVLNELDEPRVLKHYCEDPGTKYDPKWMSCACDRGFNGSGHGFTLRPASFLPIDELIPIFSSSKISKCFVDILFPSHLHLNGFGFTKKYEWEEKKLKAIWRGSNTGGAYGENTTHFSLFHRQRLVSFCQKTRKCDAKFSAYIHCDTGKICDEQKKLYGKGYIPLSNQYTNKIILDIDGNTYSGRFIKLLASGSCVFKIALFEDFATVHVKPWVHYVPIKMDLSDLEEKLEWAERNDEKIKKIAESGRDYAHKHFKYVDIKDYVIRLLRKYHSLLV